MSRALLAVLWALGAPTLAAAQVGRVTDTISGTVVGPDGQPLVGAITQATSATSWETRRQSTDAGGRFIFVFYENAGRYEVIVRYFGMRPATRSVERQGRQDPLAARVRMDLAAVPDPIAAILSSRDSLGLSVAQAAQLRRLSDSLHARKGAVPDPRMAQVLARARSVLTSQQWARLSGVPRTAGSGPPASAPLPPPVVSAPAAAQASGSSPRAAPAQTSPAPRPGAVYTGLSNVYDSNIDHTPLGPESYGLLAVLGGQYRQRFSGTTVELRYDGVFRRYTNTDVWNRPGHTASGSIDQRVGRHWTVGAAAEVAINGSAEDRVLRNEYSVQPELEYRFTRATRLQLYGEYLVKRYPNPVGQDAVDPRVGVRFRRLFGTRGSFGMSGRYEYNRADSTRHRYIAWTGGTDLTSPVGPGGRIASSVRYRIKRYSSRLVDVGSTQVLRRDDDLVATVVWQQALYQVWELVLSYRYESYQSNDTRREFRDHLVGVTVKRWW
ncbi:MAG TPA: carboxypeptidase regulatory-like domain-containing protein [Gemmatimonadales bacterium]|nr:carboxypeptidase regulatory-like domain-containing protein [Gemmatimonadales bacterium]